ncbi:10342_t:CDS:2 [Gigaspora rosea]|nr:10342_t:CDS:2 [Gigaspora rosea]
MNQYKIKYQRYLKDQFFKIFQKKEIGWPVFEQNLGIDGWNDIEQEPAFSNWMNEEPFDLANTNKSLHSSELDEKENPSFVKKFSL